MTDIWFTSDTHYGHKLLINKERVSNPRPFDTVEQMDEAMIANHNSVVKPLDKVFHLGDFSFNDYNYLKRLNGEINLILGNHDRKRNGTLIRGANLKGWASIQFYYELIIEKQHIVLFHFAQRTWNGVHRGSIHLYGHSHHHLPGNAQSLDVGVDGWNFTPINFDQIKSRLSKLPPYTGYANQAGGTDHHKPKSLEV